MKKSVNFLLLKSFKFQNVIVKIGKHHQINFNMLATFTLWIRQDKLLAAVLQQLSLEHMF